MAQFWITSYENQVQTRGFSGLVCQAPEAQKFVFLKLNKDFCLLKLDLLFLNWSVFCVRVFQDLVQNKLHSLTKYFFSIYSCTCTLLSELE